MISELESLNSNQRVLPAKWDSLHCNYCCLRCKGTRLGGGASRQVGFSEHLLYHIVYGLKRPGLIPSVEFVYACLPACLENNGEIISGAANIFLILAPLLSHIGYAGHRDPLRRKTSGVLWLKAVTQSILMVRGMKKKGLIADASYYSPITRIILAFELSPTTNLSACLSVPSALQFLKNPTSRKGAAERVLALFFWMKRACWKCMSQALPVGAICWSGAPGETQPALR